MRTGLSRFFKYVPPWRVTSLLIWVRRLMESMPDKDRHTLENMGRRWDVTLYKRENENHDCEDYMRLPLQDRHHHHVAMFDSCLISKMAAESASCVPMHTGESSSGCKFRVWIKNQPHAPSTLHCHDQQRRGVSLYP